MVSETGRDTLARVRFRVSAGFRASMVALLVLGLAGSSALAGGEIYGTIQTFDGRRLTGPIRWDVNENFWDDELHGSKADPVEEEESDGPRFSIFGIKIGGGDSRTYNAFSIPFGHLKSIEPLSSSRVLLTLKGGTQIEVRPTNSDMGRSMRSLIIDDESGRVELDWRDLERVDFTQGPKESRRDSERLYGTVETDDGSFTGSIVWDRDESLVEDILDGEEQGRDHEVPFSDIRKIESLGREGSRVTLKDGTEMVLEGTNDVDRGHRGVTVTMTGLGVVDLDWDDVRNVVFADPPESTPYAAFDGGTSLRGRVKTTEGKTYTGEIVWDRDESFSWETLDGRHNGTDYSIRFSQIRSIKPRGSQRAEIKLTDGRVVELSGSNDVSDDNRGIVVQTGSGNEIHLEWDAIELVEFD